MSKYNILLFIVVFTGCHKALPEESHFNRKSEIENYFESVTIPLTNYDSFILLYSDSLNSWNKDDTLPYFIYDCNFDFIHPLYLKIEKECNNCSLREDIFNKVNNLALLDSIINSLDTRLDLYPVGKVITHGEFSYLNLSISNRQLAKKRLKALK